MKYSRLVCLLLCIVSTLLHAQPSSFDQAKDAMRQLVYFDQSSSDDGTIYCGSHRKWHGESGGQINLKSCGYSVRKQKPRAERLEWEHIVPAWVIGHQRQCWQNGGRSNCESDDPVFSAMEADMFNLAPAIGEVNGDRSNYRFGVLQSEPTQYGQCKAKVNLSQRTFEPRDEVKGIVARTYFYIHDRYDLRMSKQQQRLFMAWNKQHPVTSWERLRDQRIAKVMGHHNPFVTGERSWAIDHKNSADGLVSRLDSEPNKKLSGLDAVIVRGNRNSMVYHLSEGCPSYDRVSPKNRVPFASEAEALAEGYRKAGNCG